MDISSGKSRSYAERSEDNETNENERISIRRLDNERLFHGIIKKYGGRVKSYNFTDTVKLYESPVWHLKFAPFEKSGFVRQCFSTRLGGVSSGMYESMNLTFNDVGPYKADTEENVLENFRRMSSVINIPTERMVYSKQTHTTNVMAVSDEHAGMGIVRKRSFDNIDGLITKTAGLCLVTSFADCIPVVMADERHRCIASVHAGWRGTVGNIAAKAVSAMSREFGSLPEDLTAFIGPGICADCYEVGEDVAERFKNTYNEEERGVILGKKTAGAKDILQNAALQNEALQGKFYLNLPAANYFNLLNAGLKPENIYVSDICTCCNSEVLFSHRASGGRRGILCNFTAVEGS